MTQVNFQNTIEGHLSDMKKRREAGQIKSLDDLKRRFPKLYQEVFEIGREQGLAEALKKKGESK